MKSFEFTKSLPLVNIHADYQKGWKCSGIRVPSSYAFKFHFGIGPWKGAGYIHGITFFIARNSGSRRWQQRFRGFCDRRAPLGFEIGFTRNGNQVPYVSH